jgi:hypothetical protein
MVLFKPKGGEWHRAPDPTTQGWSSVRIAVARDRVTLVEARVEGQTSYAEVHDWSPGDESWTVQRIGPVAGREGAGNLTMDHARGGLVVAWIDAVGDEKLLEAAYRRPDAATFEPVSAVPDVLLARVGIDGAGVVSVVGVDPAEPEELRLVRRDPHDGSWSPEVVLYDGPGIGSYELDVDESGWALIEYRARHEGKRKVHDVTCSPDGTCEAPARFAVQHQLAHSALAAGPGGSAAVIWTEYNRQCEECLVRELWARYRPAEEAG